MTAETFSPGTKGIMTNLVKLIRWEQVERWTSTVHGLRTPEVHCYATPVYNLGKCRLMDEFSALLLLKFYEIHISG